MDGRRLAVMIAIGLVLGGGALVAVLLLGSEAEPDAPIRTQPAEVKAPPLTPVDAKLLGAAAPKQPKPAPFLDPGKTSVKTFGTLHEGEQATQIAFTPDGNFIVAMDYSDAHLRVWDWRAGKVVSKVRHENRSSSLAMAPDGKGFWTGDAYANLHWWPLAANGQVGAGTEVGTDLGGQLNVAVSPNGRLVATVSYEKILSLWDAAARELLARVTTEEHLRRCTFSPDGKRLVVGTSTNLLLEYQLATGEGRKVQILPVKPDIDLMSLAFSPDGRRFSTGHNQPWITVWEGGSMTYERWLKCPETGGIWEATYTRDSALLAFALSSGELFLWKPDVADEAGAVATLKGHEKFIRSLAFSPDGRTLASGDEAGVIHLWASAE
jgi:WD40 repeat protein